MKEETERTLKFKENKETERTLKFKKNNDVPTTLRHSIWEGEPFNLKMMKQRGYQEHCEGFKTIEDPKRPNKLVKILANGDLEGPEESPRLPLKLEGPSGSVVVSNNEDVERNQRRQRSEDHRRREGENERDMENTHQDEGFRQQDCAHQFRTQPVFTNESCNRLEPIST